MTKVEVVSSVQAGLHYRCDQSKIVLLRHGIYNYISFRHVNRAVLRLRGSICHMRGFIFTNARKIYYHLRVSIARFLITFTGNLDI